MNKHYMANFGGIGLKASHTSCRTYLIPMLQVHCTSIPGRLQTREAPNLKVSAPREQKKISRYRIPGTKVRMRHCFSMSASPCGWLGLCAPCSGGEYVSIIHMYSMQCIHTWDRACGDHLLFGGGQPGIGGPGQLEGAFLCMVLCMPTCVWLGSGVQPYEALQCMRHSIRRQHQEYRAIYASKRGRLLQHPSTLHKFRLPQPPHTNTACYCAACMRHPRLL